MSSWNGVSILAPFHKEAPDGLITSDVSGRWGCGAFHEHDWFQLQWNSTSEPWQITIKELIPIVIAASTWGHRWAGKTIRALCDNMAVVHIINSRQSRDPDVMHLLRCLSLIESTLDFNITSKHLPGVHNDLADALSRNNCAYFLSHFPQAHPVPTPLSALLLQVLVTSRPDWTSVDWASLFKTTISKV